MILCTFKFLCWHHFFNLCWGKIHVDQKHHFFLIPKLQKKKIALILDKFIDFSRRKWFFPLPSIQNKCRNPDPISFKAHQIDYSFPLLPRFLFFWKIFYDSIYSSLSVSFFIIISSKSTVWTILLKKNLNILVKQKLLKKLGLLLKARRRLKLRILFPIKRKLIRNFKLKKRLQKNFA